jgi:hypothetical protein
MSPVCSSEPEAFGGRPWRLCWEGMMSRVKSEMEFKGRRALGRVGDNDKSCAPSPPLRLHVRLHVLGDSARWRYALHSAAAPSAVSLVSPYRALSITLTRPGCNCRFPPYLYEAKRHSRHTLGASRAATLSPALHPRREAYHGTMSRLPNVRLGTQTSLTPTLTTVVDVERAE